MTFEYQVVIWERGEDVDGFNARLAALGAEGWEAVGMSPRRSSVPMPGMGASAETEIAVLLKREAPAS